MDSVPVTVHKAITLFNHNDFHDNVCLLCLKISDNLSGLDELVHVDEYDYTVKEVLKAVTFDECKLQTNTQLKICLQCLTKASETFSFRLQYLRSQRALQALLRHKSHAYRKNTALIDLAPNLHNLEEETSEEQYAKNDSSNAKLLLYECRCKKIFPKQEDYERHVGFACLSPGNSEKTKDSMESNIHRINVIKSILYDQSENICCFCLDSEKEMVSLDKNIKVISAEPGQKNVEFNLRTALGDFVPLLVRENIVSSSVCANCLHTVLPSAVLLNKSEYKHSKLKQDTSDLYEKVVNVDCNLPESRSEMHSLVLIIDKPQIEMDNHENDMLHLDFEDEMFRVDDEDEMLYIDDEYETNEEIDIPAEGCVCSLCGKRLKSEKNLKKHLILHMKKVYSCKFCDKRFPTKTTLGFHLRKVHGLGPKFICDHCGKECLAKNALMRHIMYFHLTSKCPQCSKVVKALHLKRHIRNHGIEAFTCDICDRVFPNETLLDEHVNLHSSTCNICEKTFDDKQKFYYHAKNAHKTVKCEKCSKNMSLAHYKHHLKIHNGIKPYAGKTYQCPQCDIAFRSYFTRRLHIIKVHGFEPRKQSEETDYGQFICDVCGIVKSTKLSLARHITNYHKTRKCQICDKVLKLSRFRVHMLRHGIPRDYKFFCEHCPKSFKQQVSYTSHMNTVHLKIRPFSCDICGRCYKTKPVLARHKKLHLGLRPFECTLCKVKLSTKQALVKHMRVHTGEKPYKCDYCDEMFGSTYKKRQHTDTIHDKKAFACKHCGSVFDTRNLWRGHIRKVHKIFVSKLKFYKTKLDDDDV